jgi:hypothetical protein
VSLYRGAKADLIAHIKRNKNNVSLLSFYCATSGLPVAAAIVFCLEEFPEHKEKLEKKLETIKEFYGYKTVVE